MSDCSFGLRLLGERPLPSCLGGGDLDGDMYNVTNVPQDLLPIMSEEPASYAPAERNILGRPSTMGDVAKFVVEFILSDVGAFRFGEIDN